MIKFVQERFYNIFRIFARVRMLELILLNRERICSHFMVFICLYFHADKIIRINCLKFYYFPLYRNIFVTIPNNFYKLVSIEGGISIFDVQIVPEFDILRMGIGGRYQFFSDIHIMDVLIDRIYR